MAPPAHRLLQTYTTTSTRTSNVGKLCPANLDRTTLVDQNDISQAKSQREELNSALGIDGYLSVYTEINSLTMQQTARWTKPLPWPNKMLLKLACLLVPSFLDLLSLSSSGPSSAAAVHALTAVLPSAVKKQKMNHTPSVSSTGQQLSWSWLFAWPWEHQYTVRYWLFRFYKGKYIRTINQ